ncbi:VOC family protein [Nocardiopsis dassonvillei]|uniref:VOC family protein n=1 Tax=Nocardiopsis dassonvillei TaxID=2014 RepID=UPI00366BF2B2
MNTTVTMSAIEVDDLERSTRFYTDALGLVRRHDVSGTDFDAVLVGSAEGSGAMLELTRHRGREQALDHGTAFWKLCLSTDDIRALFDRAVAHGARPVLEPQEIPGTAATTIALVKDPDGYLVELVQSTGS